MFFRLPVVLSLLLFIVSPAHSASNVVNGVLTYRDFTVDMTVLQRAANRDAVEASLKKQIDIARIAAPVPRS